MKKLIVASAVSALCVSVAPAAVFAATISNTGPGSTNKVTNSTSSNCTSNNNNNINVQGNNSQSANSGSSNGSKVDGQRIAPGVRVPLAGALLVEIGAARLLLEHPALRGAGDATLTGSDGEAERASMSRVHELIERAGSVRLVARAPVHRGVQQAYVHELRDAIRVALREVLRDRACREALPVYGDADLFEAQRLRRVGRELVHVVG